MNISGNNSIFLGKTISTMMVFNQNKLPTKKINSYKSEREDSGNNAIKESVADLLHILNSNSFQLSRFPKNFGAIFAKSIILQNHNFEQYIYYMGFLCLSRIYLLCKILLLNKIFLTSIKKDAKF